VPELERDLEADALIDRALLGGELLLRRTTARWALPAGLLEVARLGVAVPQAVIAVQADARAFGLVGLELLDVVGRGGDEALAGGELLRRVEDGALRLGPDRQDPLPPALRPGLLQPKGVALIGPAGAGS
jgi:hypothetical protein